MPAQTTRYLPLKEAAAYIHVSPSTFRRMLGEGRIPAYRPRGALRFKQSDLDAYMASTKEQALPEGKEAARSAAREAADRTTDELIERDRKFRRERGAK